MKLEVQLVVLCRSSNGQQYDIPPHQEDELQPKTSGTIAATRRRTTKDATQVPEDRLHPDTILSALDEPQASTWSTAPAAQAPEHSGRHSDLWVPFPVSGGDTHN
jgi:hypothetical protein